ncbi:MAG: IS3 family transposase [bacterium]|nr:IS3 family transposase [bacterium]
MSQKKKKKKKTQTNRQDRKPARGLRPGRRFSDEERRAAVSDAAKLGLSEAARKHEVATSTLHGWTKSPRWTKEKKVSTGGPAAAGRRFTDEVKQHAMVLVVSGMKRTEVARAVGTTSESIRRWVKEAEAAGTMPTPVTSRQQATIVDPTEETPNTKTSAQTPESTPGPGSVYKPRDPGQGLSDIETAAILTLKKKYPSMGPAQIRAQLKRFKGWRVSIKAIARVLRANGYERVHRGSRPQGPEPQRFEAPRRNALWQLDYAEMRVAGEVLHLLVALDDFSRYCVGHTLGDEPSTEVATELLGTAMARHGKPEAVRTDRGGAFTGQEFGDWLEAELIDHIVGRAYHPQGGGKVESLIGTVRRELWDVEQFADRVEAERRLAEFLADYNERRAHMGIDGLTPADRFFGRADRVLAVINAISRKRQGELAHALGGRVTSASSAPRVIEELVWPTSGAPLEVLRLVATGGRLELRFAGHRVVLGQLESP